MILKSNQKEIPTEISNVERIRRQEKVSAYAYRMLTRNEEIIMKAHKKFCKTFDVIIDQDEYHQCFIEIPRITTNAKMKSFQFRLLHSAIVCNN